MKGYLEDIFSQEIIVPKDTTFTSESTYYGCKINTQGSTKHGGNRQVCRPWMANILKILQYAYHRQGWKAFNIKLNVLPRHHQHLDEQLALEGRRLFSQLHKQIKKDVKSYDGYYRIHLERDVESEGGYHYHIALVARGIQSEAAIEIAFKNVQKQDPRYLPAYLGFIAPDIKRVANDIDRAYFEALGVAPNGSRNFLDLTSDASYEYMAYVYSYHAKRYTKESLIADKVTIASGNRIKHWSKGIHRNADYLQSIEVVPSCVNGFDPGLQQIH